MAIIEGIAIWLLISAAFTPLIGHFLGKSAEDPGQQDFAPEPATLGDSALPAVDENG